MVTPTLPAPFEYHLVLDANHKDLPSNVRDEICDRLWVENEYPNGATMKYMYQSWGSLQYPQLDTYLYENDLRIILIRNSW